MKRCALCLFVVAGCAANAPKESAGPQASAPLHLLQGCGSDLQEEQMKSGWKRFRLQTGRGYDPMRVTVDGQRVLEKQVDVPDAACATFDLPPGRHSVAVSVSAKNPEAGLAPILTLREWGPAASSWYRTFDFSCGHDPCEKADVDDAMAREKTVARGLHDACGSTRIERLRWRTEHSSTTKLEDLQLDFDLHVYQFVPTLPTGSSECGKRRPPPVEAE